MSCSRRYVVDDGRKRTAFIFKTAQITTPKAQASFALHLNSRKSVLLYLLIRALLSTLSYYKGTKQTQTVMRILSLQPNKLITMIQNAEPQNFLHYTTATEPSQHAKLISNNKRSCIHHNALLYPLIPYVSSLSSHLFILKPPLHLLLMLLWLQTSR